MAGDMMWTQPRSLTFSERKKLTWALFSLRLPRPVAWLTLLWSAGTIVSSLQTDQPFASLRIESENGRKSVMVTVTKETVTET